MAPSPNRQQRGLLRRPVRRQPPGSILRQNPPSPPQPAATDKLIPRSTASPYAGYSGTPVPATTSPAASPKANPPRSHPLPQALYRSRDLSDHHIPTGD